LSRGEFPLAGPAHWHLHLIDETVLAIAGRMVEHPGSYLLLAVVAVSGLRALRSSADGPDRLALIAGLVWLGHALFLVCAYLTVFEPWEAETAAEFWRYSTQTGLLGMAAAAALLVRAAKRLPVLPRWQVFGIGVLLTALLAEPDTRRILPQVRADLPILEMIGRELAETLPEGARIAVLRPRADALAFFMVRYRLWRPGRDDRDLRAVRETHEPPVDPDNDLAWLRNSLADHNVSHILVEAPTSAYADALGITESADGLFLLEKGWEQWSIAKRWPEIR
jgi:hypothetical protein